MMLFKRCGCDANARCEHPYWYRFWLHRREHRGSTHTANRDLAHRIARLVGFDGQTVWDITRPNGQPRRALDTTRAQREFGFTARTTLDQGLERTVDWYRREEAQGGGAA